MKPVVFILGLIIVIATGSYAVTRTWFPVPNESHHTWLQREFKLNDTQLAAIEQLQIDYAPVCTEHCRQVMRARRQLADSPHDIALRAEISRLEEVCRTATTAHLQQVATKMPPEQGRRFLALMESRVATHDHAAPLGLR